MPPRADAPAPAAVPLVDLKSQHRQLREEVMAAVATVANSQRFIQGPEVALFERALAAWLGVEHAVGVSSGTDALLVALMALEIGPGDEVITSPFTFVSTAEVIRRMGARPLFADLMPETLLMRTAAIEQLLSSRTRAVIPVHLYGQVCDMEALCTLSNERGFPVIEDCAQALGAEEDDRKAGSFGRMGAFSFFPTKVLGGWGDGGMLVTGDGELADRVRQIREHGAAGRDHYLRLGGNFRLDTLQAAVLGVKLKHLDAWLAARRQAAARYDRLLVDAELAAGPDQTRHPGHRIHLPAVAPQRRHAYNLYVIQAERRDELRAHLAAEHIQTGVYYPVPLHLQPCFSDLGYHEGDLPVAEEAARNVLALPLYPEITEDQQERVVDAVARFYRRQS